MKIIRFIPRKEIEKEVMKRKCDNCTIDCYDNCKGCADRCPSCNKATSNDLNWEFNHCPYCGQKLKY